MGIKFLGEKFGQSASDSRDTYTATRVFNLIATGRESGVAILKNESIPVIGEKHPDNPKLICESRSATPLTDDEAWEVTCSYSPASFSFTQPPSDVDPWNLPPFNVSYGAVSYNKVLERGYKIDDSQGEPSESVLNSAGDAFDPPAEKVEYNSTLKFSYNKRHFTLDQIRLNQGTINSQSITVLGVDIPSWAGRINMLSAQKMDVNDDDGEYQYSYYQIDVEIEVSVRSFVTRLLDIGFYKIDNGKKKEILKSDIDITIKDSDDGPVTEPQKLDGAGGLLGELDPVYLSFLPQFPKNWDGLNLPKTLNG
jgi:hypothetical protein